MKRNKKKGIIAIIILLAVGFAAVSTSLIINGTALFGTNTEDFDVYFSKAVLDGDDVSGSVISTNGKTITYETNALAIEGDESILEYTVLNNSTQYDAKVEITCELEENAYVIMENTLENEIIKAQSEETGTLTATLIKTAVDPKEFDIVCNITPSAVEKEDVTNIPDDTTYSLYGTLVDENGEILTNTTVVTYSNPVYAITDEDGYFYIEGLEKGTHSLYVMGNTSIEDIKDLSESEIKDKAVTAVDFTTSTMNIVFENGYEMTDEIVEPTEKVTITFDANGGIVENDTAIASRGNYHGELPELTREGYRFIGWYTEASGGTKVESTSIATESKTIYARWTMDLYNMIATNADKATTINFSIRSGVSGTNGIYTTTNTESGSEVYYYRGKVDNNIKFANLCWRIVRTTESGGIKLIYNGIPEADGSCNNTGANTEIGTNVFNSTSNDNSYLGYMYGSAGSTTYAATHANTNESDMKKYIDAWYLENMENKGYTKYLEDTVFCNDRTPVAGGNNNTLTSDYGTLGYGSNITGYGALARASYYTSVPKPSLVCKNTQGSVPENNDAFTVSEENGNGKLTYPVGLITLDEVVFAGFNTQSSNPSDYRDTNNYLTTGSYYWTLSPVDMGTSGFAYAGYVRASGNITGIIVSDASGVRPVVSLAGGTEVFSDGTGTVESPYVVAE